MVRGLETLQALPAGVNVVAEGLTQLWVNRARIELTCEVSATK
jgi:hypothetical protein